MPKCNEIKLNKNLVCISVGGNMGDVIFSIKQAVNKLKSGGFELLAFSSVYRTTPVDCSPCTPDFYNAIILGNWKDSPQNLLFLCQKIEKDLGRNEIEKGKNESRPIDLDIIFIGNKHISDGSKLVVPHPRATSRLFVMIPLAEIMPNLKFPGTEQTVKELLTSLINVFPAEAKKILKNKIFLSLELE